MVASVDVVRGVQIPIDDGTTLAADLVRPRTNEPVPTLLTMVPYRRDTGAGIEYSDTMHWFAERGYASLLVDFPGTGGSTGKARPPFDPDEATDAAAAIAWIAEQPWCSGSVGMWGVSYGSIMSMRTASLNPPALKAIIPIVGTPDLGVNFVHPGGVRGGLAAGYWGTGTLLSQLLPPVRTNPTEAELTSWRARLQDTEPYLLDLWRHRPGDPVWSDRAIDASAISVPALCVAGWRDLFCDGSVRAYEQMRGPKRLVAGPWMHTKPHESPYAAIEFREVMLRWWDYWLRSLDSGAMDEPAVTVYVQGAAQPWRGFDSWPPGKQEFVYAAADGSTLAPYIDGTDAEPAKVLAHRQSDPTVGTQTGLWFTATGGFGLPLDERDDDLRGIALTSAPLTDDVIIVGRPSVTVTTGAGSNADRLVARLTDVDPDGRSMLITTGLSKLTAPSGRHNVELTPTAYLVPAGHRIRVVLGDADFPHVWPAPQVAGANPALEITGVTATVPTIGHDDGEPVEFTDVDPTETLTLGIYVQPRWQLTRDLVNDGVTVVVGWDMASYTYGDDHVYEYRMRDLASVQRAAPSSAVMEFHHAATGRLTNGTTVSATVDTHITETLVRARGEVRMDGAVVFEKVWES